MANLTILRAELDIAEGISHREMGDRSRATAELEALATAPAEATLIYKVLALLELVHAHLDERDLGASAGYFDVAEDLVEHHTVGEGVRGWLARAGTALAIARGDFDEAHRWSGQIEDPFWRAASIGRTRLAVGDRPGAAAVLETAPARCVRQEVVLRLLQARAADDEEESVRHVTVAVELAVASGLMQTVATEGQEVMQLVELAPWAPEGWIVRLQRAAGKGAERAVPAGVTRAEALTGRELAVLRFLPSRLTVREIANELYISQNTLKFHLKVIYRKLGVNTRAAAATKARSLSEAQPSMPPRHP